MSNVNFQERKTKLPEGQIIPLTTDFAFKMMWGNENHPEVTALLISKLLKIPYEEVEGKIRFTNSRNQNLSLGDKNSDKDVSFIVDTSEPLKISLEMNFSPNAFIYNSLIERNLYYLSNFFGTGLGQRSYSDLKTTIQFNFNMDFVDKEHKKLIDVYTFRNEEGHVLTEIMQIVHINIAEIYDICYNRPEELKKFDKGMQDVMKLLACIVTNEAEFFNKMLDGVDTSNRLKITMKEMVEDMKNDEELCVLFYDKQEENKKIWDSIREEYGEMVKKESFDEGHTAGLEQGLEQKEHEIVVNMKEKGFALEVISDITNLSIDKIEKILENK